MSQKKMDTHNAQQQEWTYRIEGKDIDTQPKKISLAPEKDEKDKIAERLDLKALEDLEVNLSLQRVGGGNIVKVEGVLNADVIQQCVVSLEPVKKTVQKEFDAYYTNPEEAVPFSSASKKLKMRDEHDEVPMMDEWEDPEWMDDGAIDLGELVVQHLSLGLEDFPKKEGQHFEEGDEAEMLRQPSDTRRNPFAALQYWKNEDDQE